MRTLFWALILSGCHELEDVPTDTDTDSDTDTDTDSDTDTDTDADIDTGTEPPSELLFDEDHALAVSDGDGVWLIYWDGTAEVLLPWTDILSSGAITGGPLAPDGNGLLLAYLYTDNAQGGIARVNTTGELDFTLGGFAQPAGIARDPMDGAVIAAEAYLHRVFWMEGDGASRMPLRTLDQDRPNDLTVVRGDDGRNYLLVSSLAGKIALWDITDPENMRFVWDFPSEGSLSSPHSPLLRYHEDQWWLLYAHGEGLYKEKANTSQGSVGVAVSTSITSPPQYVADLDPDAPDVPVRNLTGLEFAADGWLFMTDMGTGRILKAPLPDDLLPTGATGAYREDQVVVELPGVEQVFAGLDKPFRARLWAINP